jgi:hypothetical protein
MGDLWSDDDFVLATGARIVSELETAGRSARRGERLFLIDPLEESIALEAFCPSAALVFSMSILDAAWVSRRQVEKEEPQLLARWRAERDQHFLSRPLALG